MSQAAAPSWLADEERGDQQPLKVSSNSSSYNPPQLPVQAIPIAQPNSSLPVSPSFIHFFLRATCMFLCLLMFFTALYGLSTFDTICRIHVTYLHECNFSLHRCWFILLKLHFILGMISSVGSSERVFVACYMLFFSALLFFFELNQMRPIESIDHMYRRNFGFLYGALTKSLFIILWVWFRGCVYIS